MFPDLSCLASVSGLWHGKTALSHWTRRLWPWHGAGGGPSTSDQTDPHSPFTTIEPETLIPAGRAFTGQAGPSALGRGAYTSSKVNNTSIHSQVSAASVSDFKRQESFTLLSAVMFTFTSPTAHYTQYCCCILHTEHCTILITATLQLGWCSFSLF